MFKITDHVEFNKGRASCPCCEAEGKSPNKNLALVPNTDGAYKCFRGCASEDIRNALGNPKPQQIPEALAQHSPPRSTGMVSPQKVKDAHIQLTSSSGPAKQWLYQRGFTDEMITHYRLGITRAKVGDRHLSSITIPIPNADGTAYYQKKRIAPWLDEDEQPLEYRKWSQSGIPARVWFTWLPTDAQQTFLCEGEWDAMMLGWAMQTAALNIAVATFTCGCESVPPAEQLDLLPGEVVVFYDRNDNPLKSGELPGEKGAKKVARALGDRARIGLVPMPDSCDVHGWDVSNALIHGYGVQAFIKAATEATAVKQEANSKGNPLKTRMVSNDALIARAPEYVEWLVPDLLTADELFGLGAPPRGGKSIMCMSLANCVATGQNFLDRPVTQGSVIYVNLEDGDAKIRSRAEAQQWQKGLPIYWLDRFKLNELPYLIEVADEIEDLRLIILDTLTRVRSDDKAESSAEMGLILEPLQEFAKERKVCVVLVHHTTKINPEKTSIDEIFDTLRGSGSIRGTCRGLLIIAPGDNHYRLCVENGWGKHDLKIRFDSNRLEWQLLGKWNPVINADQRDITLHVIHRVGSATIDTLAEETGIPKRSLYTVLDRLRADGIIEKIGTRRKYVYQRAIQHIQLLNSVLNSANEYSESDTGYIQQKNKFSIEGDHRESDHPTHTKDDHLNNCVTKVINGQNPDSESDSAFGSMSDTKSENADGKDISENDHFANSTEGGKVVEYSDHQGQKTSTEGVSPIQQLFNSYSTVEYKTPDCNDHLYKRGDQSGTKNECDSFKALHSTGLNETKKSISERDIVRKRHKQGWRGTVKTVLDEMTVSVLWAGDKKPVTELVTDLEVVSDGA